MPWADRTEEEQQGVIARLNEQAQPMRDAIARETADRDASTSPEAIAAANAAIASYEAALGPIDDAIALLSALA